MIEILTGSDSVTTFVGCWPCDHCGNVVSAGLCSDECGELMAFCEECSEKCDDCHLTCERDEHGCKYGGGYTFVRPDERRRFQMKDGSRGWWDD